MATSAWRESATAALEAGDWEAARTAFVRDLSEQTSADTLDGLAHALWWLKEPQAVLDVESAAYRAFLVEERYDEAAAVAVRLAREHHALHRDDAVAVGWLGRARRLCVRSDAACAGWIDLADSELCPGADEGLPLARRAVVRGRAAGDHDLELVALARTGLLEVTVGEVDAGTAHVNEAMAAAAGGEASDPQYAGEAFCALLEVATLLGDQGQVEQWAGVLADFHATYHPLLLGTYGTVTSADSLSAFCGSCCGAAYVVTGRLDEAERELREGIAQLTRAKLHARCVHPVAQLAELWIAQGRMAEAEALLRPYEDLPECVRPLAVLDLARGQADVAVDRLRSALGSRSGEVVRSLPLWSLTVDACVALADARGAHDAAAHVTEVARLTRSAAHRAESKVARGKAASLVGDAGAAELLRAGAVAFAEAGLPLAACRARLARARVLANVQPGIAVAEARAALAAFERLGARHDADQAASLLRSLGFRGLTGPRRVGDLSRREEEVLTLLARGLTNAEIGDRLFISTKTAGHHVSSILTKLGLRSRTEAAAFAVAHATPTPERGQE